MENNSLLKLRTINETVKQIKELDPATSVTYNFIRKLCKDNKIKYIKCGNKILINYDDLMNFLSN